MNSNKELYEFIDRLKDELERQGESAIAESLVTAMYISSVGTEVFLALRSELAKLLNSDIQLSSKFQSEVREAIVEINRALSW